MRPIWLAFTTGLLACSPVDVDLVTRGHDLFVSPTGDDAVAGTVASAPLRHVQTALARAQPGDTIHLADGRYDEDVASVRDGRADAPITIAGARAAVVVGAGAPHVFEIRHDHLTLSGFTVDGLAGAADQRAGYRDKLVFVLGRLPRKGVTGLRVVGMKLANAGGECVRLRYFAVGNELRGNEIGPCGVYDFRFHGGGENGQGIYVGTALDQLGDGKNPTADRDASVGNVVRDNQIATDGAECVAIKEAADRNEIRGNVCSGAQVADGAGLDVRSNGNLVAGNQSFGHAGAGVRLGGAADGDGVDNDVRGNDLHDNRGAGLRVMRGPQRVLCGNTLAANAHGDVEGDAAAQLAPAAPCP